jgi:Transposase DDE domain
MEVDHVREGWRILRGWLPADLDERAKRHGLWRRSRGLQDAECWLRLFLMHVAGGLSLEQTVIRAREMGLVNICPAALFKRLCHAQAFLRDLTEHLLVEQRRRLGRRDRPFPYRLRIIDATDIREPGSTGTDLRLHYSIRLPELTCDHFELTDARGGETLGRYSFEPGELVLANSGYSHRAGVALLLRAQAQVVFRWNPGGFPLEDRRGRSLAPLDHLRSLKEGQVGEWSVQFRYEQAVYPLRLCVLRKDRQAAEQGRRRTLRRAQRDGTRADPEALELSAYVLLLTSVSPTVLSTRAVLDLYRGRWQIELVFKRLKSLLDSGHVPKSNDTSALAWMQAKILCALLLERVLLEGQFFSSADSRFDEVSRWRVVMEVRDSLRQVLAPPLSLAHLLKRGHAIALSLRSSRPKRPMQLANIRNIFRSNANSSSSPHEKVR